MARKLNYRKKKNDVAQELKGTHTTLIVKQYFYELIKDQRFGVYSITLNKRRVYERLTKDKERVYNYVSRLVLDQIPFEKNDGERIILTIDKCKGKPEIQEFNEYIKTQLEARINPKTPVDIVHKPSHEVAGLQSCDLFCWGIFQKYERDRKDWYDVYKAKINYDNQYL